MTVETFRVISLFLSPTVSNRHFTNDYVAYVDQSLEKLKLLSAASTNRSLFLHSHNGEG